MSVDMKGYPKKWRDWTKMPAILTELELVIGGWQVMQAWEHPLMEVMAAEVTSNSGDILEIGYGMGISAREIIKRGCRSYTIIEAHPEVAAVAREWAKQQSVLIDVIEGFWQDVVSDLGKQFDGILFDTYPLSEEERHCNHFAFIPVAPSLLRHQGLFTYYSDETVSFRAEHMKLLLTHFSEVKLIKIAKLKPYSDCEYWDQSEMIIPVAKKLE